MQHILDYGAMPLENPEYGNAPLIISQNANGQTIQRTRVRDCIPFYTNLRQTIMRGNVQGLNPLEAARMVCEAAIPADSGPPANAKGKKVVVLGDASDTAGTSQTPIPGDAPGPFRTSGQYAQATSNPPPVASPKPNVLERLNKAINVLRDTLPPPSPSKRPAAPTVQAPSRPPPAVPAGINLAAVLPRRTMGDFAKANAGRYDIIAEQPLHRARPAKVSEVVNHLSTLPPPTTGPSSSRLTVSGPPPLPPMSTRPDFAAPPPPPMSTRPDFAAPPPPPPISTHPAIADQSPHLSRTSNSAPSPPPVDFSSLLSNPSTLAALAAFLAGQVPPQA
jgi:hypothetical protein